MKALLMISALAAVTVFPVPAQMGGGGGAGGPGAGAPPPGGQSPGGGGGGGRGGRQAEVPGSTVGLVAMAEIPLTTKVGGRLIPARAVSHAVSANGLIRKVYVDAGQAVKSGDPLFSVVRDDLSGSYVPALVSARISGIVSTVSVKPDAAVRSGDQGVVIIDTKELHLEALLSDKDALSLSEGTEVVATVVGGLELKGSIHSRSPEPDYQTGLFTLTLSFPATPGALLGQFATAELPLGKLRGIFLPQDLLQRMYGRYQVWVVDAEGLLQTRRVTIGAIYGNRVLIEEGLAVGERILLKRSGKEKAGDKAEGTVD